MYSVSYYFFLTQIFYGTEIAASQRSLLTTMVNCHNIDEIKIQAHSGSMKMILKKFSDDFCPVL